MLSYQHAYHAGNRADMHKHETLVRALGFLKGPVTYVETHAGRGKYDLSGAESIKTGEAAQGWLKLVQNKKALNEFSPAYIDAVRALNKGKLSPLYPGSPYLAAHVLRKESALRFYELHPAEYAALKKNMGKDKRAMIAREDGMAACLAMKAAPSLVLIDPSYEVKAEYETVPGAAAAIHEKWPQAKILIWAPMLPALRHEILVKKIREAVPGAAFSECAWAKPGEVRGLYGSIMVGINIPEIFQKPAPSFITSR